MWRSKNSVVSKITHLFEGAQDVLSRLQSMLEQLSHVKSPKQTDSDNSIERAVNRLLHEQLPKILQQIWHELCVSITKLLAFPTTDTSVEKKHHEMQLTDRCGQLAFLRSIYRSIMFIVSGKSSVIGEGMTSEHYCIAQLLTISKDARALPDVREQQKWLGEFVLQSLCVAQQGLELAVASLSSIVRVIAVGRNAFRAQGMKTYTTQQKRPGQPSLVSQNGAVSTCYTDDKLRQDLLNFFGLACLGLSEDIIQFLTHEVQRRRQQPQLSENFKLGTQNHEISFTNTSSTSATRTATMNMNSTVDTERSENTIKMTKIVEPTLTTGIPNHAQPPLPYGNTLCMDSLADGHERWVFFRTRPGDKPSLSLEEVAAQVQSFYEIYNPDKTSMAKVFAEGFADDYADLFDSLEYQYCYASTLWETEEINVGKTVTVAAEVVDTTPTEMKNEKVVEDVERTISSDTMAAPRDGTQSAGCWVM